MHFACLVQWCAGLNDGDVADLQVAMLVVCGYADGGFVYATAYKILDRWYAVI